MVESNTPVLDACLLRLPGRAKVHALLEGRGIQRKDVAGQAGAWANDVTRALRGGENDRIRNAIAQLLGIPRSEIDSALEDPRAIEEAEPRLRATV